MEAIAVPVSFVALVWVFGGLLAAAVPMAVGGFAILVSLALLRALSFVTDVSVFALNVAAALGLALAIDYTLLIINRYREEVSSGRRGAAALVTTMTKAGRTVLFSALTVALSLSGLVLFPMPFLRSFAYAGVAVVGFAALAAVVLAPAMIVMLGDRLDALNVRRLGRRPTRPPGAEHTFWYRIATLAMRHAIPTSLAVVGLLLVLGAPFLGVRWGNPDDRVLPASASARAVSERIRSEFAKDSPTRVTIVVPASAKWRQRTSTTTRRGCHESPRFRRCPRRPETSSRGNAWVRRRRPPEWPTGALISPWTAPRRRTPGRPRFS